MEVDDGFVPVTVELFLFDVLQSSFSLTARERERDFFYNSTIVKRS